MDIDRADLAMFVYNTAAVMSGGYLAITVDIQDTLLMLPISLGLGLVWTVYYHVSMASLLEDIRTGELFPDDDPEPGADPDGENGEDGEEALKDDDHQGVDPPWSQD